MDASKLLNILLDLTNQNEDLITEKLNSLIQHIGSNQNAEISDDILILEKNFKNSIINNYNKSNLKIMEKIGAIEYFGNLGFDNLSDILNKNAFNIELTINQLNEFSKNRNLFLELANSTAENLEKLKLLPHFHNDNIFEVGLLMSEKNTENKITNITKELSEWNQIFGTLTELTTG